MSRWAVRSFLDTVAELRPDQREIILGMFYRRFIARLTDDKEPMYRALHAMNRAFVAMRKGGFSDEQWVDVQELMEVVNQGRLKERLEIHREASSTKNQKIADRHSKIPADAFRREWSDPRAPRDKNERARAIARKYGTSTETVLRRIRDWKAKGKLKNS